MASQDEPTQPSTQQVLDPRRVGRNNSGLDDDDIADVLLILHPATPAAIRIVENAANTRPEHVLFYDSFNAPSTDIEEQDTIIIGRSREQLALSSRAGADLALRMSSAPGLKVKYLGFIFGRNPHISDIVFGTDTGRRISNQHFRIYFTSDCIFMLEDMSTNGTIVDNVWLKGKDPHANRARMLSPGSEITVQNTNEDEVIRFIVRIPNRVTYMERFNRNVREFLSETTPPGDREKALQRFQKQPLGATSRWDGGDRYNFLGQLGKGAFATVYQIATKMDGKLFAAKELEKRRFMKNGQLEKKVDNEMKIMQGLRHPNIVEFVEYYDKGDYLYIIMEYVRYGDLQKYLNENGPLVENLARPMAQQILSALGYLHRAHITHRDIKPDNILIADTNPIQVKLSDFGLSKVVNHEETFLKTFCGTLLYCAPEVFPDFHGQKSTKRRRGVKQYNAYSSSVDIWSFAGVLWYAICGDPPFKGIADATGEAMYNNIMSTPLNSSALRKRGISERCIDLLCKMLQTNPADRPTEIQCLKHPWLRDGAAILADPTLQSIVEEDESAGAEEQLSQLSLGEIPESDDEADVLSDIEFEMLIDSRLSKRARKDPLYPRNQIRDRGEDDSSDGSEVQMAGGLQEDESFKVIPTAGRQRLFGEIGESALQSSRILDAVANEALSNEDGNRPQELSNTPRRQASQVPRAIPQLDGELSSPSLLGAESLVRELNMASPHSPGSGAYSPNEPTTPKTPPDIPQHNSLEQSDKHPSQISDATPKAKPTALSRQIILPKTPSLYWDPFDPTTHTLEYATKVSGFNFVAAQQDTKAGASQIEDTMTQSETDGSDASAVVADADKTSSNIMHPEIPGELDIKPPPRRLGKLTATPDSFAPTLVLNIDQSRTSWGRWKKNTLVYENVTDTRIPKTAFIIFWWSSNADLRENVQELSQQGKDWTTLDDIHVGIFNCATSGITVNGKHIKQKDDKGRAIYGHLHTGDIVQVYHDSRTSECLKFKCEFYVGAGKERRAAKQSFAALHGAKLPE